MSVSFSLPPDIFGHLCVWLIVMSNGTQSFCRSSHTHTHIKKKSCTTVSSLVCLVDSVEGKWWQMCMIWCLTLDGGSLSPLCALTDHITISESFSVRRRSYGPVKGGLREKQASSDMKKASGRGIRGDWTWRVLAVRCNSFLLVKSCFLPPKLHFAFVRIDVVI